MKSKRDEPATDDPVVEESESKQPVPAISPPGRVNRNTHGPSERLSILYGVPHLRDVMGVSGDVSIERVCEDAAAEIARLRAGKPPAPWPDKR